MSYDTKCHDLAKVFLEDEGLATQENIASLAQLIQDTIEDEMDFLKTPTAPTIAIPDPSPSGFRRFMQIEEEES